VISTPVTYLSGIACAATHNVLVRGGVHLETLGRCQVVAIDKTGTLTQGSFVLREFHSMEEPLDELDDLWRRIAAVQAMSSHPIAAAFVAAVRQRGIHLRSGEATGFTEHVGEAVSAIVDELRLYIGNAQLASRKGWTTSLPVEHWAAEGATVLWVGNDEKLLAVCSVADAPKPEAKKAVAAMMEIGLDLVMLTGDVARTAAAVGTAVGISAVHASLKPEDKIQAVLGLRRDVGVVAMVGDGINDVPSLAAANVGIAMGAAGRPAALEAADIVLMDSDLEKLVLAVRLGRTVLRKIRQNIIFAVVSKFVMVVSTLLGFASLWGAIAVDVGAMLVVTLNGTSVMAMRRRKSESETMEPTVSEAVGGSFFAGDSNQGFASPPRAACFDGCCKDSNCSASGSAPILETDLEALAPPVRGSFCASYGAPRRAPHRKRRPLDRPAMQSQAMRINDVDMPDVLFSG